jgi:hypothetical protein
MHSLRRLLACFSNHYGGALCHMSSSLIEELGLSSLINPCKLGVSEFRFTEFQYTACPFESGTCEAGKFIGHSRSHL